MHQAGKKKKALVQIAGALLAFRVFDALMLNARKTLIGILKKGKISNQT